MRASEEDRAQRVVVAGPDDDARRQLHLALDRAGHQVSAVGEAEDLKRLLANQRCDAVFAHAAIAEIVIGIEPPLIAILRARDAGHAAALLARGVDDVIAEPIDDVVLVAALHRVARMPRRAAAGELRPANGTTLIGSSAHIRQLRAMIDQVARTRSTVLVLGESGTGKELVARAIHDGSPRRAEKFVAVNCAALPPALLESELFGHKRGSFTDAIRDKVGLFEEATGGTLFLDEIGELPLALQVKLLRVLQEGEVRPVGDNATVRVDVRLIAATLRDLASDVADGRFREDLYYRLNVLPLTLPPLRDRSDDIVELAQFFAARHAARHLKGEVILAADALAMLRNHRWPGNVRELENVIERVVVLAEAPTIDAAFLATVMTAASPKATAAPAPDDLSIKKATRELERDLISRALIATNGNRTNAAKLLEISHRALLYKMKEYGIS